MPAIVVNGVPVKLYITSVVTMLSATIIAVRELRLLPPSLNDEKKPGPTSRPIE